MLKRNSKLSKCTITPAELRRLEDDGVKFSYSHPLAPTPPLSPSRVHGTTFSSQQGRTLEELYNDLPQLKK